MRFLRRRTVADRLIVQRRGFRYPVGASIGVVARAGGLSKMTDAQRAGLVFKEAAVGERCDDMSPASAAIYIARGDIAVLPATEVDEG
jgi:hypothetical protein